MNAYFPLYLIIYSSYGRQTKAPLLVSILSARCLMSYHNFHSSLLPINCCCGTTGNPQNLGLALPDPLGLSCSLKLIYLRNHIYFPELTEGRAGYEEKNNQIQDTKNIKGRPPFLVALATGRVQGVFYMLLKRPWETRS